jgi:cell division septum initiation protein DivIVA
MSADPKLIARIIADNRDLKRKLNQSRRDLKKFNGSTKKIGREIQGSLAMAFGGFAVAGALRSSVETLANFEFQMDKVSAVSGATSEEMAKLTKNAKDLGARTKFTASEIGKLQEELARLGFGTDLILNMTDASRQLATVADTELGESAKVLGQTIRAFNLDAEDSVRVANVMAESFSKSALDLEQFSTAMSYAGTAGQVAGFSLEEVTAMLAQLVNRGIQGSKAGTALRDIFSDLGRQGLTLDEALEQINNSTDKGTTAFDLFGKTSMNAAVILAETRGETKKLTGEFSDMNTELTNMVDTMEDNLLTDFAKFRSALEGIVIGEGSRFNELLRSLVQNATELISVLSGEDLDARKGLLAAGYTRKEIALLDDVIDEYKQLLKRQEDLGKLFAGSSSAFDPGNVFDFGAGTGGNTPAPPESRPKIDLAASPLIKNFEDLRIELDENLSKLPETIQKWTAATDDQLGITRNVLDTGFLELTHVLSDAGANLQQVSLDIGEALTGAMNAIISGLQIGGLEGALQMLKGFLGDAMVTLGSALVSINTGKLALSQVPPPLGIAIGTSLIAAGALLNASANKQLSSITSSSGLGGGGQSGGNIGGSTRSSLDLQGQVVISGNDLKYVFDRVGVVNGRTG